MPTPDPYDPDRASRFAGPGPRGALARALAWLGLPYPGAPRPPRRPVFWRAPRRPGESALIGSLLAIAFIVIIVASVAYIVRHRGAAPYAGGTGAGSAAPSVDAGRPGSAPVGSGGAPGTPDPGSPVPSGSPGASGSPGPAGGATMPGPGAASGPAPGPSVTTVGACPAVTEAAARRAGSPGGLRAVRYVLTARSEAWVCRDPAGRLWYQGHLRTAPLTSADSGSSLLLGDVANDPAAPGAYVATNHGAGGTATRYRVSRTTLVVQFVDAAGRITGQRSEVVLVTGP